MYNYGKKELDYLRLRDPKLGELFDEFGIIRRKEMKNPFEALICSIVGQQISAKAQESAIKKIKALIGRISPANIINCELAKLRACGLSERKALAIVDAAKLFANLKLSKKRLLEMQAPQIEKILTSIKGVGPWTAEMLMIFALDKPDILSYADFGIRKALSLLHDIEKLDKKTFEKFRLLYSPYGSVASVYLWEFANRH